MKPVYDREPDQDDLLLKKAIEEGVVPPACKLGGAIVQGISAAGGDPCETCSVNRDLCGGRPMGPETAPSPAPFGFEEEQKTHSSLNDGTTARKHQRKLTIMQLNRMIKEKSD